MISSLAQNQEDLLFPSTGISNLPKLTPRHHVLRKGRNRQDLMPTDKEMELVA